MKNVHFFTSVETFIPSHVLLKYLLTMTKSVRLSTSLYTHWMTFYLCIAYWPMFIQGWLIGVTATCSRQISGLFKTNKHVIRNWIPNKIRLRELKSFSAWLIKCSRHWRPDYWPATSQTLSENYWSTASEDYSISSLFISNVFLLRVVYTYLSITKTSKNNNSKQSHDLSDKTIFKFLTKFIVF